VKKHRKWFQSVILFGLATVAAVTLIGGIVSKQDPPGVGDPAPDFVLPGLDGGEFRLSDYRGRPVLINFWGTYCPPCVAEMPLIQQYYDMHREQGLVVLGVNENDPVVTARAFVRQLGLSFPILMDRDRVRKAYGVTAYPTTFFIDGRGRVVAMKEGEMNEQDLRGALSLLLGTGG
jgi:peroxiredoxin